jgi:hypothetical protein
VAAEVTAAGVALMAVAVISEAGVILPAVAEDTVVAEDMVAIGVAMVAMEDEEATGITEVTAVGAGAALASGSDFTTHLCLFIIQRFGARTARLITTPMTITINGTEMRTSMKP